MHKIKGNVAHYQVAFTVDTSAYAAGDLIDAVTEIPRAVVEGLHAGKVVGGVLTDADGNQADIDINFFNNVVAAGTDNQPFDPTDTELTYFVGCLSFTQHKAFNDNSVSIPDVNQRDIPFELGRTADGQALTSLYIAAVAREAVTFTAGTDLTLNLFIEHGK